MTAEPFLQQLQQAQAQLALDPLIGPLIPRYGPCQLVPHPQRGPFEALVRAVTYQQLHGKAAETILNRFIGLFPDLPFPSPEAIATLEEADFRRVGLSRQKAAAIQDIALRTRQGEIPLQQEAIADWNDAAIIQALTQARGVGRWTVEMFLMFTLGRLDVLPVDDFGVRAGYQKAAAVFLVKKPAKKARKSQSSTAAPPSVMPKPKELAVIGEAWAPWRSVASWYLWQTANDKTFPE